MITTRFLPAVDWIFWVIYLKINQLKIAYVYIGQIYEFYYLKFMKIHQQEVVCEFVRSVNCELFSHYRILGLGLKLGLDLG